MRHGGRAIGLFLLFGALAYVYLRMTAPTPSGEAPTSGTGPSPADPYAGWTWQEDPADPGGLDPFSGWFPPETQGPEQPAPTVPNDLLYDPFTGMPWPTTSTLDLQYLIDGAAARYGVSSSVIANIVQRESSGNPNAQSSSSSARGLMGMTRAAALDVGADYESLFDPATAIDAGTHYLSIMIGEFGERDGVRAYYAGPGTIRAERRGSSSALMAAADTYASAIFA